MDETKYVKHEFKSGEKLYAAQLNEMDAQIALNETNINLKADKTDVPTKTSQLTNDSGFLTEHQSLDGYAKTDDIPTSTSELTNSSGFITNAVDDLANYYQKSETYTQTEIDEKISLIPKFSISVATTLPTSNISTTTVYLVRDGAEDNLYTEYIYVDNKWEILGSQRVDLTDYAKKSDIPTDYAKEVHTHDQYLTEIPSEYVEELTKLDEKTYILKDGETIADAPVGAEVVYDPNGDENTIDFGVFAQKTGWAANKYLGTDASGNLVEKDAPTTEVGITTETDPTVPEWAKQPNKPTYTASEVGAATAQQATELFNAIADYDTLTLGVHTDGLVYIFKNDVPFGTGIELPEGGGLSGYVDSENNIILKGNYGDNVLVKYEMEDGTLIDIGELNYIPDGPINYADPTSADWLVDHRLSTTSGSISELAGQRVTNYIPVKKGDVLWVKGLRITEQGNGKHSVIHSFTADKTFEKFAVLSINGNSSGDGAKNSVTVNGDVSSYTILMDDKGTNRATNNTAWIRLGAPLISGYTDMDVIIRVNEPIE